MPTDDTIFKTVYVDRDVDRAVLEDAARLGATAASVYRLYLEAGLVQLRRGAQLPALDDQSIVLRTAYVPFASDELLRGMSTRLRIDLAELNRRVTKLGMLAVRGLLAAKTR